MEVFQHFLQYFAIFCCITASISCVTLKEITHDVLGTNIDGVMGTFVDFNMDKLVDILLIQDEGHGVEVLFASREKEYTRATVIEPTASSDRIVGVESADFDGDLYNDVLLVRKVSQEEVSVQIYWGKKDTVTLSHYYNITSNLKDHPVILDWNGDMYPDLLAEKSSGDRVLFIGGSHRNFTETPFPCSFPSCQPLHRPQSSAFVDLNSDLSADLLITAENGYEVYHNVEGQLTYNRTIDFPGGADANKMQQISVADIDRSGYMSLIVPVCNNTNPETQCEKSLIWAYHFLEEKWYVMLEGGTIDDQVWNFHLPTDMADLHGKFNFPVTARMADYNMDGYPDTILIVTTTDGYSRAVLFENKPCTTGVCKGLQRTFAPDFDLLMFNLHGGLIGAFFDVTDNGFLEIIVGNLANDGSGGSHPVLTIYEQEFTMDACHLRVQVASGLCSSEKGCPADHKNYGVNVYGPSVKYVTMGVDGNIQTSIGSQLSQSAHFALQLPNIYFGLGANPNYVEKVYMGIPDGRDRPVNVPLTIDRAQTIPNSHLILEPFPLESPTSWKLILLIRPSALVYYVGIAMLGTILLVGIVAGILQWRERREDAEEKRQESHKFHFDAM